MLLTSIDNFVEFGCGAEAPPTGDYWVAPSGFLLVDGLITDDYLL
jgi:hypothetical protein